MSREFSSIVSVYAFMFLLSTICLSRKHVLGILTELS